MKITEFDPQTKLNFISPKRHTDRHIWIGLIEVDEVIINIGGLVNWNNSDIFVGFGIQDIGLKFQHEYYLDFHRHSNRF